MKVDVVMPKMGESVNEGTIIKWHKEKGDKVEKDEIIFEISTDKVDTEIPAPESGVLSKINAYEQETVEAGEVVAVIETEGEAGGDDDSGGEKEKKQKSDDTEDETEESKEQDIEEEDDEEEEETPSTTQAGGNIVEVTMPKMGESVMEGTIVKWHKKEGDSVEKDEIIFDISTDKVDTEVPAPEKGTLVEIVSGENETVEVGEVVAKISTSGGLRKQDKKDKSGDKKEAAKKGKDEGKSVSEKKEEKTDSEDKKEKAPAKSSKKEGKFFSPVVMNIAQQEDIPMDELQDIEGTGAGGRVTKKDVLAWLEEGKKGGGKKQVSKTKSESKGREEEKFSYEPTGFEEGETEIIPMDNVRKRIMYHMKNSRDTSVHVTAVMEADITNIYNYLKENKERISKQENVRLTYLSFVAFATIKALKEFPYLNASIDEDDESIVLKKFINLGLAVAVEPNGLIVPNIKHADEKNIKGLSRSIVELSNKARNKGLKPEDIMDGTFTITNYGIFGSLFGTPIINQPEVGILGVGAVTKKPVVVENNGIESIAIKPMMYLSLAHDHRLVDGMLGGKFLSRIKEILENFDVSQI